MNDKEQGSEVRDQGSVKPGSPEVANKSDSDGHVSAGEPALPAAVLPGNGAPPPLAVEPLARFRREHIQDTVVFFGSARFRGREEADHALELLDNTGSRQAAPSEEQPASVPDIATGKASDLQR